MPWLNGVIKRRSPVITVGALAMLLNVKLNDTAQKILWSEAFHTCERMRNSMENTGSKKIRLEFSIEKNLRLLGRSQNLEVFHMSRRGEILRNR